MLKIFTFMWIVIKRLSTDTWVSLYVRCSKGLKDISATVHVPSIVFLGWWWYQPLFIGGHQLAELRHHSNKGPDFPGSPQIVMLKLFKDVANKQEIYYPMCTSNFFIGLPSVRIEYFVVFIRHTKWYEYLRRWGQKSPNSHSNSRISTTQLERDLIKTFYEFVNLLRVHLFWT